MLSSIKDPDLLAWLDANPAVRAAAERQEAMAAKYAHLDQVLKQVAKDEKAVKRERLAQIEARNVARLEALKNRRSEAQAAEKVRLAALRAHRQKEKALRQEKPQGATTYDTVRPTTNCPDHPTTDEGRYERRPAAAAKPRARIESIEAMEQKAALAAAARPLVLRRPAGWGQG